MPATRTVLADRVAAVCEQLGEIDGYLKRDPLHTVLAPDTATTLSMQCADAMVAARRALQAAADVSAWTTFSDAEKSARRLMAEVFSLVQGQMFSDAGLDEGISAAVGALLEQIRRSCNVSRGVLVTFSPDPESLDHTIALVRVRFPGTTVWDLPFAVHEFGHHAVREMPHINPHHRDERPLHDLVRGHFGIRAGLTESHAHELVADVFATFALGATYPLACILRRVDGNKLDENSDTHPSWRRRVAAMVATLDRMSMVYSVARYSDTAAERVMPAWRAVAAVSSDADPPDQARLHALADQAVDLLERHASALAYDDRDSAVLMKDRLADVAAGVATESDTPRETTCAAIIDAAWRWRLSAESASTAQRTRVNNHAVACCAATPTDRGLP